MEQRTNEALKGQMSIQKILGELAELRSVSNNLRMGTTKLADHVTCESKISSEDKSDRKSPENYLEEFEDCIVSIKMAVEDARDQCRRIAKIHNLPDPFSTGNKESG